ncbi:hypothetical protein B5E53_11665 [Eubacterium sp. An11]|uniref:HlyD family efflux transporter periplasmic adaptor subunit n=1 Tax=Eubacterium sp. An11 TaxID=1965542 RepID=UPI000B3679F6|nr:HlyD family efflux transporter periplasmic adaptor subunit [Eubacterium sp. An11]OUQ66073.1 hypothetical protein B5E53_11665 [Eubacterium sp. An11]
MAKKKGRKRLSVINLGTVVFLVIIIYLTAYVIRYLGKEKLAIYEVSESNMSENISGTGMILREETLITTEEKGYVNYYVKDGSRVRKDGIVYTLDTTGKLQSYLNELLEEKNTVSDEEKQQVYKDLQTFSDSFSDDNFSEVYEAKSEINHDLMSYTDTILADNKDQLEEEYGSGSYVEVRAGESGLVSFFSDGMEKVTDATFTKKDFDNGSRMEDLRSREELSAGSPVYRMVTGQNWTLVIPVNEDDYNRMKNLEKKDIHTVQVTFRADNFVTNASFECQKKEDSCYVMLKFDNYVQRYINQRYLSVRLQLSETSGLQIPASSLVQKDVYKIPAEYLTRGSNSSSDNQVNVLSNNKNGEEILTQVTVTKYRTEGENVLIASDKLKAGDRISNVEKAKTYTLKETSVLQGVYVVNRGYAEFKPVTILERTEDYCIISADDSDVELYDRVILNSETIKENQVIY